ncbi:hypothetical protein V5799_007540 [Amblyomma americanum]|uniref:Uncharacterized protein n=1 Tax=Amblyomma americanum TaxID=6943 RepID=A0AAQ4FGL3_AMBAM
MRTGASLDIRIKARRSIEMVSSEGHETHLDEDSIPPVRRDSGDIILAGYSVGGGARVIPHAGYSMTTCILVNKNHYQNSRHMPVTLYDHSNAAQNRKHSIRGFLKKYFPVTQNT